MIYFIPSSLSPSLYIFWYVCMFYSHFAIARICDGRGLHVDHPLSALNIGVSRNLYWHGHFHCFGACLSYTSKTANCWKLNLMIGKERQHVLSNFMCHCAHTLSWTCPLVPPPILLKELPNSVITRKDLYLWKFCLELSCGMCYLLSSYT